MRAGSDLRGSSPHPAFSDPCILLCRAQAALVFVVLILIFRHCEPRRLCGVAIGFGFDSTRSLRGAAGKWHLKRTCADSIHSKRK